MGLAPDHKVARRVCQALAPANRAEYGLSLEDFQKLFMRDKQAEKLVQILERVSVSKINADENARPPALNLTMKRANFKQ